MNETTHTETSSRPDLLDMAYINRLPQPLFAREFGSQSWWPVNDIEVQTGLYRIDVCGKLDVCHVGSVAQFRDADGRLHDPEDFYVDSDRAQRNKSDEEVSK
jgi:hypothetical protein